MVLVPDTRETLNDMARDEARTFAEAMALLRGTLDASHRTRRTIERDLHDGAQQRLVSLSVTLQLAERLLQRGDVSATASVLKEVVAGIDVGLAELTQLADGAQPDDLRDGGLVRALAGLARRSAIPVELVVATPPSVPYDVAAATYFVVSEALANVVKHADAHQADVVVCVCRRNLRVVVSDDGRGGADANAGSGLQNLTYRVRALDGRLHIDSPPGAGTVVTALLPLA